MDKKIKYYMPTKIVYEKNEINNIDHYIAGRKALLVTSEGFVKRGLVDKIKSLTDKVVFVVSDIKSHPDFRDLKVTYNKVSSLDYDVILAVGGGSVIDTAKFLSVQSETKQYQFVEDIIKKQSSSDNNYSLTPIISIPTTAGTGSEITPWATIWDMEEKRSTHYICQIYLVNVRYMIQC